MAVRRAKLVGGQSNSQPTGLLSEYLALVPDLNLATLTLDPANPNLTFYYGRATETFKFLTFFNPEQTAAFPGGSPPAPFSTFKNYALFLPWTILEGTTLNVLLTRTDNGGGTTNQVVTTPGTFSAGDVGTKWIRITSAGPNLNQRRLISAVVGTDTAQWVTALPATAANLNFTVNDIASRFTNANRFAVGAPVPAGGVGFSYPNAWTRPKGPLFDETVEPLGQLLPAYSQHIGISVDIAYRLTGWMKATPYIIPFGMEAAQLQFTEGDLSPLPQWGWFQPKLHKHWSPADETSSLAQRMLEVLDTAKLAAQAAGDTLIIDGVCWLQGETDSTNANATALFAQNCPAFVDWLTQAMHDRGLLECAPWQLPFGWPKIPSNPWPAANVAVINAVLDQMQRDRPAFFTWDTNGFAKVPGDPAHFSAAGIRQNAEAWFNGFLAARQRNYAAVSSDDVPTLAEMRASVLRITQNNTEEPDANTTAAIDEAINMEIDEFNAMIGDSGWYLRQMTRHSISVSPGVPFTLPRTVQRLLEIRPVEDPSISLEFSMTGHADQGRVQIIGPSAYWTGQVDLHHRIEPRKLVGSQERPVLPKGVYVEAVIVGAAVRMVSNSGNAQLETKLRTRREQLRACARDDAARVDRQRRQRMRGNRGRMIGPVDSRYPGGFRYRDG